MFLSVRVEGSTALSLFTLAGQSVSLFWVFSASVWLLLINSSSFKLQVDLVICVRCLLVYLVSMVIT